MLRRVKDLQARLKNEGLPYSKQFLIDMEGTGIIAEPTPKVEGQSRGEFPTRLYDDAEIEKTVAQIREYKNRQRVLKEQKHETHPATP